MVNAEVFERDGCLQVAGDVGFVNVEHCLGQLKLLLKQGNTAEKCVNFSHIRHLDGSVIALMTSLLRHAKSLGIKVSYTNVPDHILRISELYGVRTILPIIQSD